MHNPAALGILSSCHKALHAYAAGLCAKFGFDPSSAADALHEFYTKLLAKYPDIAKSYEEHGPPYLFAMVRREVLTMHRKAKSLKRIHHVFGKMSPKDASLFSYSQDELHHKVLSVPGLAALARALMPELLSQSERSTQQLGRIYRYLFEQKKLRDPALEKALPPELYTALYGLKSMIKKHGLTKAGLLLEESERRFAAFLDEELKV